MRAAVLAGFALILCTCGAAGYTVTELERIASSESILEITQAAGLALVDVYAATKPIAELEELAESTHIGIALAAHQALRVLDDPLAALVGRSGDELRELAYGAATSEERLDASRAYFLITRGASSQAVLEEAACAETEWALAAGEVLGGFYAAYRILDEDLLRRLAVESPFAGIRRAASVALTALWVADGLRMTDEQIEVELVWLSGWQPDLAQAYTGVLAHRFLEGLESQ